MLGSHVEFICSGVSIESKPRIKISDLQNIGDRKIENELKEEELMLFVDKEVEMVEMSTDEWMVGWLACNIDLLFAFIVLQKVKTIKGKK